MSIQKATALAHSNIAFVKYWGHADSALRLPANPTLSVNLSGLDTQTTVEFDATLTSDELNRPTGALGAVRLHCPG